MSRATGDLLSHFEAKAVEGSPPPQMRGEGVGSGGIAAVEKPAAQGPFPPVLPAGRL